MIQTHTQFVEKVDREMTQSFDGGKVVEGELIAHWAQYIFFLKKKSSKTWLLTNHTNPAFGQQQQC